MQELFKTPAEWNVLFTDLCKSSLVLWRGLVPPWAGAGGIRVRLDLFCFIQSEVEGLYQDKKEKSILFLKDRMMKEERF